jgi:hypothetical protein
MFFSHTKSANSVFQPAYQHRAICLQHGQDTRLVVSIVYMHSNPKKEQACVQPVVAA